MGLEALFGDGVVGLELHAHVVVLGGDDLGLLRATELAVQLGVSCESTAHLHEVVLAHVVALGLEEVELQGDTVLGGGHQLPDAVFVRRVLLGPARAGDRAVELGEESATGSLTAALVGGQLVPRVTAALVAAQGVEAPLLTAPTVGPRALVHFFEKVDSKTGFVNGPVRDELEPEAAGRALDVIRLLVATVAPDEGAALAVPVAHLQVVIGAAVVALNLEGLEGEAHVEALGHLDPPDADFAGPVIIGVIGRLDVAIVLFHISPADGFIDGKEALPDPVATASEFNPEAAVGGDDRLREFAPAEAASEGRLPPKAISDLHVVVPAQAATVQVHGCEVQNDLLPRCDGDAPYTVHVGGVAVGVLRRGEVACAVLQGLSAGWTLVELAGLGDVPLAEPSPLADGRFHPIHLVLGNDGVQEDAPGECVAGIVHDTVKIVGLPQGLYLLDLHLQEVILLSWLDVLAHDGDVAVPVGPRVLVPEADDVAQLMHHDSKLVTVLADGDGLRAPTTATHVGAAPAGSIGEYNVAVLVGALQEGDTGVLLPVPHGLPEDGPLAAGEVSPNDKGDDPIGPHALRSGRRRPPAPGPASPPPRASPLRLPLSLLAAGGRGVSCSCDGRPADRTLSEVRGLLHLEGPQILLIQGDVPEEGSRLAGVFVVKGLRVVLLAQVIGVVGQIQRAAGAREQQQPEQQRQRQAGHAGHAGGGGRGGGGGGGSGSRSDAGAGEGKRSAEGEGENKEKSIF